MKKTVLAIAACVALNAGAAFAAPVNDLGQGHTALGAGSDTFYLEHKLTDNFTIGYQNVDRDQYGHMNDVYGQLELTKNFRAIVGSRDFDYTSAKAFWGAAVSAPLAPDWEGYASLIAGSHFQEVQVGTNIKIAPNVDLNLNYHNFKPDYGSSQNGLGVGATFKF